MAQKALTGRAAEKIIHRGRRKARAIPASQYAVAGGGAAATALVAIGIPQLTSAVDERWLSGGMTVAGLAAAIVAKGAWRAVGVGAALSGGLLFMYQMIAQYFGDASTRNASTASPELLRAIRDELEATQKREAAQPAGIYGGVRAAA